MRTFLLSPLLGACTGTVAPVETPTTEAPTNTPVADAAAIDIGECEGNGLRTPADSGLGDSGLLSVPTVRVEVDDASRLVVHLDDVRANCCPSPDATFTMLGDIVLLSFVDVTATRSCDCACITDFVVTSEPLAAGDWQLRPSVNGEALESLPVTIP